MERFSVTQRPTIEGMKASLAYTSFKDASYSINHSSQQPKQVAQLAIEEAEISIFDAERYFNEGQDQKEIKKGNSLSNRNVDKHDVPTLPRFSSVSSVDGYGRNYRTASFNATPTASSEASWNSQSGLLSNPPGSIAVSMRNIGLDGKKKNKASSNKWFLRRRCPCSGKKSVQVEEKGSEPKIPFRSHCNSNMKQSSKAEEVRVDKAPIEMKSLRNDDEIVKVMKLNPVHSKKEEEVLSNESEKRYSAENTFPTEISQRVLPSTRSFGDGGGFSFPILNPPPPPSVGKLLPNIGKKNDYY